MRLLIAVFAFVLATVFAPNALHAESFDWPGHGKVNVAIPSGWNVKPKYNKLAFYLMAEPQAGPHVNLQLTLAEPTPKRTENEQLKGQLKSVTRRFVKGSVEKVFDPKPLPLSQGLGLMVDLTDASQVGKPAEPDNYKIQRCALAFLDEHALLIVTILFDEPSQTVEEAMSLLSSFHFERAAATGQNPAASAAPFTFTVPQSRVMVKISDASLHIDNTAPLGPNYFKVSREEPQLILSGWLEPASSYKGIKSLWQKENHNLTSKGGLAPTRVEMLESGPWQVVAFDVSLPGGTYANLSAERVLAGTWIDLHLSTTSTKPPAKLRAELLEALRQVEVIEK